MSRSTILFGNGLGMSLNPDLFSLDTALNSVWSDNNTLSVQQKDLIRACLPRDTRFERPSSEDDLDNLQRVLAYCDFLRTFRLEQDIHWLSEEGREFPSAIRRYIHQVASFFYRNKESLPENYTEPLVRFIRKTKPHIATLNYDSLLYSCFLKNKIINGLSGELMDGFTRNGFRKENLYRNDSSAHGWYLHLHGSPLFQEKEGGNIVKLNKNKINKDVFESTHLVVTHVKHKMSIINSSIILSSYWQYFKRAINESDNLIIVGYSGFDPHINNLIANANDELRVFIVEWSDAEPNQDRSSYWNDRLKKPVSITSLNNILDFSEWGRLSPQ